MVAFSLILWTFRPRRVWPEFYGVDIDTAKNSIFRSKQRPILQATLTNKTVFDFDRMDGEVAAGAKKKS